MIRIQENDQVFLERAPIRYYSGFHPGSGWLDVIDARLNDIQDIYPEPGDPRGSYTTTCIFISRRISL